MVSPHFKPIINNFHYKNYTNTLFFFSFFRKYRTKEKLLKHLCKSAAVVDEKYEESIDNPDPVDAELCEVIKQY